MHRPSNGTATEIAALFLTRAFLPEETIALLVRRSAGRILQRITPLERVLETRYLGWLAHENVAGANIHVGANPLHPQSRRRTKGSIAKVRHLYLDLDVDGEARLTFLQASDRVPTPNAIVQTSPGKYQVLWRVEEFMFEQQEAALKRLALAFGGDPACTDLNRVLRLPGFLNLKYHPAPRVTVEFPCHRTWTPADFRLDISPSEVLALSRRNARPPHGGPATNSEHDWAWVSDELARGSDAARLTRALAALRSDKPNPLYYAQRTVDVASARLWLSAGIAIGDVITMLEFRRRFEIPAELCSVRAEEIAWTAARMIDRSAARRRRLPTRERHESGAK
jgi:RepB DNA-primase from phage plasmid